MAKRLNLIINPNDNNCHSYRRMQNKLCRCFLKSWFLSFLLKNSLLLLWQTVAYIHKVGIFFNWQCLLAESVSWGRECLFIVLLVVYAGCVYTQGGGQLPVLARKPRNLCFQLRIAATSCCGVNFSAILSISGSIKASLRLRLTIELEDLPIK